MSLLRDRPGEAATNTCAPLRERVRASRILRPCGQACLQSCRLGFERDAALLPVRPIFCDPISRDGADAVRQYRVRKPSWDLVVSIWAADWSVRPPRRALFKVLVTLDTRAYHMPRGFAYRESTLCPLNLNLFTSEKTTVTWIDPAEDLSGTDGPGGLQDPTICRRTLLKSLAALGVGTVTFRRALAAQAAQSGAITPEMIKQAQWIAGLDLTEEERKSTMRSITQPALVRRATQGRGRL